MKAGKEEQIELIHRGTVDVITSSELMAKLEENRPLNIKFGIDPTAPDIHLGHTVPLHKLKQFQDLGHNIQLVVGDYTAMIGDPSGRSKTRPMLTKEQVHRNIESYEVQLFKILDSSKTSVLYNSSWLDKIDSEQFMDLASRYTVQKLLRRRDFDKRLRDRMPLSIAEFMYPLIVGYDSVHLRSDIEIGGTDQLFNFMTSREIQLAYGQTPEIVITLDLLEGTDGRQKMSKSLGNSIGINEAPFEMYRKIMSIPDSALLKYYELISDVSMDELKKIRADIAHNSAVSYRYKHRLAGEIVGRYYGAEEALRVGKQFGSIRD